MQIRQSCPQGLTAQDLLELLGSSRLEQFNYWMRGQTTTECTGKSYNYALQKHEDDACIGQPHGPITYRSDVARFLTGYGPVDW